MRLQIPCRSLTCSHLQCFDATLYIQMNEKKPTWVCPVCDKKAPYEHLIIDGWVTLEAILKGACATSSCRQSTAPPQFRPYCLLEVIVYWEKVQTYKLWGCAVVLGCILSGMCFPLKGCLWKSWSSALIVMKFSLKKMDHGLLWDPKKRPKRWLRPVMEWKVRFKELCWTVLPSSFGLGDTTAFGTISFTVVSFDACIWLSF